MVDRFLNVKRGGGAAWRSSSRGPKIWTPGCIHGCSRRWPSYSPPISKQRNRMAILFGMNSRPLFSFCIPPFLARAFKAAAAQPSAKRDAKARQCVSHRRAFTVQHMKKVPVLHSHTFQNRFAASPQWANGCCSAVVLQLDREDCLLDGGVFVVAKVDKFGCINVFRFPAGG